MHIGEASLQKFSRRRLAHGALAAGAGLVLGGCVTDEPWKVVTEGVTWETVPMEPGQSWEALCDKVNGLPRGAFALQLHDDTIRPSGQTVVEMTVENKKVWLQGRPVLGSSEPGTTIIHGQNFPIAVGKRGTLVMEGLHITGANPEGETTHVLNNGGTFSSVGCEFDGDMTITDEPYAELAMRQVPVMGLRSLDKATSYVARSRFGGFRRPAIQGEKSALWVGEGTEFVNTLHQVTVDEPRRAIEAVGSQVRIRNTSLNYGGVVRLVDTAFDVEGLEIETTSFEPCLFLFNEQPRTVRIAYSGFSGPNLLAVLDSRADVIGNTFVRQGVERPRENIFRVAVQLFDSNRVVVPSVWRSQGFISTQSGNTDAKIAIVDAKGDIWERNRQIWMQTEPQRPPFKPEPYYLPDDRQIA